MHSKHARVSRGCLMLGLQPSMSASVCCASNYQLALLSCHVDMLLLLVALPFDGRDEPPH